MNQGWLSPCRIECLGAVDNGVGGAADADSRGVAVTANATPGSDGAYTQIVAATAFDYDAIVLMLSHITSATSQNLIDVAIGAAAAEKIIVADLPLYALTGRYNGIRVRLPIHVPSGSRVAVRIHRSTAASTVIDCTIHGIQSGPWSEPGFTRCTTYGTVLGSTQGTLVDPGAVAHTRGTVAQIVASTTNPIKMLYAFVQRSSGGGSNVADDSLLLTILQGAATEKTLIPYSQFAMGATDDNWDPNLIGPYYVNLPSGTRLSAQCQSDLTLASAREACITVLGFD